LILLLEKREQLKALKKKKNFWTKNLEEQIFIKHEANFGFSRELHRVDCPGKIVFYLDKDEDEELIQERGTHTSTP
jgi:hypothetical protein